MSQSFQQSFPQLNEVLCHYFSSKKQESNPGRNLVIQVAQDLVKKQDFKMIHDLIEEIQRFDMSQTSPVTKTIDILNVVETGMFGLNPVEFLRFIKYQMKESIAELLKNESQAPLGTDKEQKHYFYLLKWDKELKDFFTELFRKENNLAGTFHYLLLYAPLVDIKWNDFKLVDDMLGIKRKTKGFMNMVQKKDDPKDISLEKKKDVSLIFSDGANKMTFSANLAFINKRPFYEFPPMISYKDMDIITKHWLEDFPFEQMIEELSH